MMNHKTFLPTDILRAFNFKYEEVNKKMFIHRQPKPNNNNFWYFISKKIYNKIINQKKQTNNKFCNCSEQISWQILLTSYCPASTETKNQKNYFWIEKHRHHYFNNLRCVKENGDIFS